MSNTYKYIYDTYYNVGPQATVRLRQRIYIKDRTAFLSSSPISKVNTLKAANV